MIYFVIFIICALITLQIPFEVSSQTDNSDKDKVIEEVANLLKESASITNSIQLEEEYFTNDYPKQINEIVIRIDPIPEFDKLKNVIYKINNNPGYKSDSSCTYDAWKKTYNYLIKHESTKNVCSSKTHSINLANKSILSLLLKNIKEVKTNISQSLIVCINDKDKPESEVIKCLLKVVELKDKVKAINDDFTATIPVLYSRAEKGLDDLTTCLNNIPEFRTKEDIVLEELTKCLQNAATNIYSQSIMFFCLLFGFLHMM